MKNEKWAKISFSFVSVTMKLLQMTHFTNISVNLLANLYLLSYSPSSCSAFPSTSLDETPKLSIKGPCYPSWDPSLSPRKTDLELRPSKRETGWTRALLQLHPEESVHCVLLPRLLMLFPSCPSWGQSAQLSSFNPVNKLPWSFHKCFCFIQPEVVFAACNEETYSIN